jgi:hydrogenase maturation protease
MTPARDGALVLGLGNLLHSDDGVGVHAIRRLRDHPRFDARATLLDGGTQGLNLMSHIAGFSRLLVIDAVDVGEAPGTLVRFEGKALEGLPGKASVHQLGFADLMVALNLLGEAPDDLVVLGVQPLSTGWSVELTPPVESAMNGLLDLAVTQLESWAGCAAIDSLARRVSPASSSHPEGTGVPPA